MAAMDRTPDQEQPPAMPDPKRSAARSHAMLTRLGFSDQNSWIVVAAVAGNCIKSLRQIGVEETEWLEALAAAAESRVGPINPPQRNELEAYRGDWTSSRAGSAAQDRDPGPFRRRPWPRVGFGQSHKRP